MGCTTGGAGARSVLRPRVFSSPRVASRRATVRTHGARSELVVWAPASLKVAISALCARSGRSCETWPHPIPGVGRASAGDGTPSLIPRSACGSAVRRAFAGVQAAMSNSRASGFIGWVKWKAPRDAYSRGAAPSNGGSDIEVERELHGRRPQAHRVHLLLHLVLEPGVDHVLGEDVALEHELVVPLELVERLLERARHLGDVLQLLGGEAVDVLVQRIARIDAVLDAVQTRHQHRGEGEVRGAGRVGGGELET